MIKNTISILNSLLILVFVAFFIDTLNLSFLFQFGFIYFFLIISALKVYFLSGASGCLLEIISTEEMTLQVRRFHQHVKNLWQGFALVFMLVWLIDFLLFALFPSIRAGRVVYFSLLEIAAIYALAQWMINKKYIKPLGISPRRLKFQLNFLVVLMAAYFLELSLVMFSDSIHWGGLYWRNIAAFMVDYIHVFEFIFCSLFIFDNYPEVYERFSRQKEIFLIYTMGPGIIQSLASWFLRGRPPIFTIFKALSPATYTFREFNRTIWHERYYKSKVLVCITCFTANCYDAYKTAKEFKKRGSTVVMGGPHVTYLPEEALTFCDSVVTGPVEGVWKDVIRDYEQGTLKSQYQGPATEADYDLVHEQLLKSPPHVIRFFLEVTRGCKFRCHFCAIPDLTGRQMHLQPVNAIVELIKKIRPYYHRVTFIDNNIYSDPGYAKELFTALKPLKLKWHATSSIDIANNQETLKLARESGCVELSFGYEVSGGSFEKNQGGKFAMVEKYLEYTKIIKKAGIKIKGFFIFGFDSDSVKTLFELWKYCFTVFPRFSTLSLLTPFPGTGVYRDMLKQNRIINLNWRNYDAKSLVFRHPRLNYAVMSFFFPFVQVFFLITTCSFGYMLLIILLFFPYWGMYYSFLN